MSPRVRTAWLKDYANRLVQRDASDMAQTRIPILGQLLQLLAAAPGAELVQDRLAQKLKVTRGTVVRYSDLLESLFLIHRLPAWSRNLTKRQIQRPKVFLTDTGLNAALSNMDAAHLSSMQGADHLGPLLEPVSYTHLTLPTKRIV